MTSVQLFFCRDNVTRLAYSVFGKKKDTTPAIMICGLSGVIGDWLDLPALLAHHRQVAVFDNRFVGASFIPDEPQYKWRDQWEAVIDLADHLGWERFIVIGHSMGGLIAQAVCVAVPKRVSALICIGSLWSPIPETAPPMDVVALFQLKSVVANIEANLSDQEIASHPDLVRRLVAADEKAVRPSKSIIRQMGAMLECVGVRPVENLPTLVIHGDADKLVHVNEVLSCQC
jgi:pimeloyl-ACP methyl ester carboxylesterase